MAKIVRHEELSTATSQPEDRLRSWKEIAVYLRREVRTVQRWEKQEGLPVHRHVHNKLSSVYADKAELEAWWKNRKAQLEEEGKVDDEVTAPIAWWRGRMFVSVATLVALIIAGGLLWRLRPPSRPGRPLTPLPLTVSAGRESEPSFSPDGNQIAFCWNGEGQDNTDIYVKLIGPGDPLRLTTDPAWDHSPAWSPDGVYIAFLRRVSAEKDTVFLVPALGGVERRVSDVSGVARAWLGVGAHITWSSDSKWLVVPDKASPGEPYSLFLLSVDTGEKRRLATPPANSVGDTGPSLSPSARQLAFTRHFGWLKGDVYVLRLSESLVPEGDPKRLTFINSFAHSLSWTSDGSEIVFSSGEVGIGLWRVRASGVAEAAPLAFDGAAAGFNPTISRQGRRLAYTQQVVDMNIWRAELDAPGGVARNPRKVVSSSIGDLGPSYSPDGKRIAYTSGHSGTRSIWVCERDGSKAAQLTSVKGAGPSWSPDSQSIAFSSNADGQWEIYVTDLQGSQPQRLTTHESDDLSAGWSGDGRWVYFSSNRSGDNQVWKVPASGGQALQLTQQGGIKAVESPDGKFLYYSKSKPKSLWRMPLEGGVEGLVFEIAEFRTTNLEVVKEGVYLLTQGNQDLRNPGASISFFNLATGKLNSVLAIEKMISDGLSVSPDGKSILYTQVDYYDSGLMLVENFR